MSSFNYFGQGQVFKVLLKVTTVDNFVDYDVYEFVMNEPP